MTKRAFGELELAVLRALKSGDKMSVGEVHKALGGADKYTTIMTVMNRLFEKGGLAREREGLRYRYWRTNQADKTPTFIDQIKKKVFGLKTTALVSYLLESADDISDEDLVEMHKMLEQAKERRKK